VVSRGINQIGLRQKIIRGSGFWVLGSGFRIKKFKKLNGSCVVSYPGLESNGQKQKEKGKGKRKQTQWRKLGGACGALNVQLRGYDWNRQPYRQTAQNRELFPHSKPLWKRLKK
jgi:hypothetical protein